MTYPVKTVVLPKALNGQPNGKLPQNILVSTPGQAGGPTVVLVAPAARAWKALCGAAKQAGHTLKSSGPSSSYRTYDTQVSLFKQRFSTSPVSQTHRTWNGQTWYLKPGNALAAVPGTSNHGRGLAVDTGVELDGDSGTESIDPKTLDWLIHNEERFGFSHEVQSEPWHIRYFSGDHIPAAVLDFEGAKPIPKPPLSHEESLAMAASGRNIICKSTASVNVFASDGLTKRLIANSAESAVLVVAFGFEWDNGQPFVIDTAVLNNIRTI